MENKDELKEINIKSRTCCTFYYFDDKIRLRDFSYNNILLDEKSYENISFYKILLKNFMGVKPLGIWFDKIHDGIRYLVLFGPERNDAIYNRIRFLISEKRGITDIINQSFI